MQPGIKIESADNKAAEIGLVMEVPAEIWEEAGFPREESRPCRAT